MQNLFTAHSCCPPFDRLHVVKERSIKTVCGEQVRQWLPYLSADLATLRDPHADWCKACRKAVK